MQARSYKTEAIILARRNFGEADRILTVLTKHYGKLRVIAKGIRRPSSRKRGSLELFSQVVIFLARGKTFDIITEAEIKNNFNLWRGNLRRVGIAYHLSEVVNKLTRDGQELPQLYDLLSRAFSHLEKVEEEKLPAFINIAKKRILVELGFLVPEKQQLNLDLYIEDLIQGKLKTKRFLHSLS